MPLEIPLSGGSINAHHTLTVQLGENFLTLAINAMAGGKWSMDVWRDGEHLCMGAMLQPNANTIEAWNLHEDIGALMFVGAETTLDNLGVDNSLIWVSPDELIQ